MTKFDRTEEIAETSVPDEPTPPSIDTLVDLYWTFNRKAADHMLVQNDVLTEAVDTLLYSQRQEFRAKTGVREDQFTSLLPRGIPRRRKNGGAATTYDQVETFADQYLAACVGVCENLLHANSTVRVAMSRLSNSDLKEFCKRVDIDRRDLGLVYSTDKKIGEVNATLVEFRAKVHAKTPRLVQFIQLD
jgi:hypothetical protein